MPQRAATIVGGGIGGLAAAIALHRRGWRVEVLERAPEFTEIGAGISLWPNALHALEALGLAGAVRALGAVEAAGGVRDRQGRWLTRTDNAELARRFGHPLVVLHRADLLRVLAEALPADSLRSGSEVSVVRDGAHGPVVDHPIAVRPGRTFVVPASVPAVVAGLRHVAIVVAVRAVVRGLAVPIAPIHSAATPVAKHAAGQGLAAPRRVAMGGAAAELERDEYGRGQGDHHALHGECLSRIAMGR